jgi:predicted ATP-dependent serine protease
MNLILAALLLAQQTACGPTGQVEKRIHTDYGESIVGAGVVSGGVMFLTNNPTTGTWTILLRRQDGVTCVLMGGTGYATQEAVKSGTDT